MPDANLVRRLDTTQADFAARLDALLAWNDEQNPEIEATVGAILRQVREGGDAALLSCTAQFDRWQPGSPAALEVSSEEQQAALQRIAPEYRAALERAAQRIRDYHQHQKVESWQYRDASGHLLGQQVRPLDRVGVYVPGGKAAYPSSVLMNVLPARVAGVPEVVLVAPSPDGVSNDLVLAAAAIAGVDRFLQVGGAQAVAALAYGTQSIPAVDKIVGPGNIYVATAKRMVFGRVGIDMIAGPSEILVVCDGGTDPHWVVMDLFSQAEHDEDAQALLISPDADYLDRVAAEIDRCLPEMARADIIRTSLRERGALIQVRDLDEAVQLINRIAPEHLELSVEDPQSLLPAIRHAGAIFLGRDASEAMGDYCAGPNHVLPTAGTARFFSPLGVYDFQKRSSLIGPAPGAVADLARDAELLARGEGLEAHARSAACRIASE